MKPAAIVAFKTVIDMLSRLSSVKHIRYTLFNDVDLIVNEEVIEELTWMY